jgi:hypothetical protein
MIVRSPDCIFVLTVDDPKVCKKNRRQTLQQYFDAWKANMGKPLAERSELALLAALRDSGLCYYKVCKDANGNFPKSAPVVKK